jgi:hypothetical protein
MNTAFCLVGLALVVVTAEPTLAQTTTRLLPIPTGAWVEETKECAAERQVWAFDGRRVGYVGFNPNMRAGQEAYGPLEPFTSVRSLGTGYTEFRPNGFGEIGRMRVRQEGPRRITLVLSAPGRGRIEEDVSRLKLCSFEALSPRVQQALRIFAPALARPYDTRPGSSAAAPRGSDGSAVPGSRPQRARSDRWLVEASADGTLNAYVAGPPEVPLILVRCDGGRPTLHATLNPRAVIQGEDRQHLQFWLPQGGGSSSIVVGRDRKTGHWSAPVWSDTLAVLGGAGTAARVQLRGGANEPGPVTLAGSTEALKTALAPCSELVPAKAGVQVPVPPLGIAAGYYVAQSLPCSAPGFELYFYDGRRFAMIGEGDAPARALPLGRTRKSGGSYFLADWGIEIAVLSPTVIQPTIQDTGEHMRWCPADQIPANLRVR